MSAYPVEAGPSPAQKTGYALAVLLAAIDVLLLYTWSPEGGETVPIGFQIFVWVFAAATVVGAYFGYARGSRAGTWVAVLTRGVSAFLFLPVVFDAALPAAERLGVGVLVLVTIVAIVLMLRKKAP